MAYSVEYYRKWREKNRDKSREASRRYNAKPEVKAKKKEYDATRIAARKNGHLTRRYGISLEEYNELLEKQGYKCALCGEELTDRAHVDHSHDTGKVRAILCAGCNHGLGYLEKEGWLEMAQEYLSKRS